MIQNCQYYWAPSVSENLSYFIAGFLWATIVNLSKWGERIAKRLKDQLWENFYKMNCSRAQFPAGWVKLCFETNKQMQNILLFSCLTHTKAYTFILWTSLVCWPDRPCSTWLLCLNVHARLLSFCWSQRWLCTQWKVGWTLPVCGQRNCGFQALRSLQRLYCDISYKFWTRLQPK